MNINELENILSEVTPAQQKAERIKKWIKPNSTAIAKYGYNMEEKVLGICFTAEPDMPYLYEEVPYHLFEALLASRSKGKFIAEVFTNKQWKFTR